MNNVGIGEVSKAPRVAIGMPTFNSSQFIDEALIALRNQTYSDFILHISDNGSTDKTLEICERHAAADSRIKITVQAENMGAYRNFLYLVQNADSELFCWKGSDDIWSENWLETLNEGLDSPGVIGAFGKVVQIDTQSAIVSDHPASGATFPWTELERSSLRVETFIESHPRFGRANLVYGLYKTETLQECALSFFAEKNPDSDNDVVLAALIKGPIASRPEAILYKRLAGAPPVRQKVPSLRSCRTAWTSLLQQRRQRRRLRDTISASEME